MLQSNEVVYEHTRQTHDNDDNDDDGPQGHSVTYIYLSAPTIKTHYSSLFAVTITTTI